MCYGDALKIILNICFSIVSNRYKIKGKIIIEAAMMVTGATVFRLRAVENENYLSGKYYNCIN